jgi:amino acid adenylation domain-containing protein
VANVDQSPNRSARDTLNAQQLGDVRSGASGPRPGAADGVASPLGYGQERLWFAQQMSGRPDFFNCPLAVRLRGVMDESALRRALVEVVARHQVLRRRVEVVRGEAQYAAVPAPSPVLRVSELWRATTHQCQEAIAAAAALPFDLANEAPLRAHLFRIAVDDHLLVLTLHHLVTDEHSEAILLHELGLLYQAQASGTAADLTPLPVQYADLVVWQRARMTGTRRQRLTQRWRRRLAGSEFALRLPGAGEDGRAPRNSAELRGTLHPGLAQSLVKLARGEKAPVSAVLMGLFRVLLARHSGQRDFLIGVPANGRTHAAAEGMVGYFLNMLPIRNGLRDETTVRELVHSERSAMLSAYADQEMPFQFIVEELRSALEPGHSPLFQVHYNHVNEAPRTIPFGGLNAEFVEPAGSASHFRLSLTTAVTADVMTLRWVYDPDALSGEYVAAMAERFEVLAEAAANEPDAPIDDLRLLTDRDLSFLAAHGSGGRTPSAPGPVAALCDWATREPERVAVRASGAARTYRDVWSTAQSVAGRLDRLELPAESVTGVLMSRGADLPGALLGVLNAGLAYLPIDPALPVKRILALLDDAGARALLSDGPVPLPDLPPGVRFIEFPDPGQGGDASAPPPARGEPVPDQLAYVLYTSGSTGSPKGVAVTYGALTRMLRAMRDVLSEGAAARTLALTTVGFDISGVELFLPLVEGGEVIVTTPMEPPDGHALVAAIEAARPTLVQATPASWQLIALAGWRGSPDVFAISGGDRLLPSLADHIRERSRGLWNGYGPTEVTVYSTGQHVPSDAAWDLPSVPIGTPVGNIDGYVLDPRLRRVPPGVMGELYLGGPQLARGYLRRPGLTADRFIPNLYDAGGRLYRTGDLVRMLPNGAIEYLGRADRQLKVRGFRIEPAEVENALLRDPRLAEAVVTAHSDGQGDAVLVGYLVAQPGQEIDPGELRADLGRDLPAYLVPSLIITVDALPRTASGKYDVAALPDPAQWLVRTTSGTAVQGFTQETIASIWADLLGVYPAADQDFFQIGGHSLTLMRLSFTLTESFGVPLGVADLFRRPTVAAQADLVENLALAAADGLSEEEFQLLISSDN